MKMLSPATAVLLVATVLVGAQMPVASAGPKDKEVAVINNATHPVPVTGAVGVTGPVTVEGPVEAQQSGRWTVGIEGIPAVTVVDDREPFETRVDASLAATVFSNTASFTVPADKRLVVEFISVSVAIAHADQVPLVTVNALNGLTGMFLPLQTLGTRTGSSGTFTHYAAALPVLDHAAPGEVYGINLFRQNNAGGAPGTASLSVFISGYLMPA